MVIGAVTKGSQRFKRTYEMVKQLECFRRFWVRKGAGNSEAVPKWCFQNETSEAPEPLCGSRLNTVNTALSMASAVVPQYYINCTDYYLIQYLSLNIILDSTPLVQKSWWLPASHPPWASTSLSLALLGRTSEPLKLRSANLGQDSWQGRTTHGEAKSYS